MEELVHDDSDVDDLWLDLCFEASCKFETVKNVCLASPNL